MARVLSSPSLYSLYIGLHPHQRLQEITEILIFPVRDIFESTFGPRSPMLSVTAGVLSCEMNPKSDGYDGGRSKAYHNTHETTVIARGILPIYIIRIFEVSPAEAVIRWRNLTVRTSKDQ